MASSTTQHRQRWVTPRPALTPSSPSASSSSRPCLSFASLPPSESKGNPLSLAGKGRGKEQTPQAEVMLPVSAVQVCSRRRRRCDHFHSGHAPCQSIGYNHPCFSPAISVDFLGIFVCHRSFSGRILTRHFQWKGRERWHSLFLASPRVPFRPLSALFAIPAAITYTPTHRLVRPTHPRFSSFKTSPSS
jgi:hypothetical protein